MRVIWYILCHEPSLVVVCVLQSGPHFQWHSAMPGERQHSRTHLQADAASHKSTNVVNLLLNIMDRKGH